MGGLHDPDCAVGIKTKTEPGLREHTGDMEVLALLNLGDFAQVFSKLGMFPVFDLAYYIVSILYLKYEPGECVSHFSLGFKCVLFLST